MAIALVVVVLALLQLPARQLHLSSFWLEKGSYLLVGALGLLLCWRALKKLRLLLRRPTFTAFTRIMFITNTAAAGISISRPRSSCRPATTGGLAPRLSCRWACVPARGDHGSAVQQGNRRFGWGWRRRWRWRREPR
nr:High-affinity nickel-transport protein [Klebsiella pneumoniae]